MNYEKYLTLNTELEFLESFEKLYIFTISDGNDPIYEVNESLFHLLKTFEGKIIDLDKTVSNILLKIEEERRDHYIKSLNYVLEEFSKNNLIYFSKINSDTEISPVVIPKILDIPKINEINDINDIVDTKNLEAYAFNFY